MSMNIHRVLNIYRSPAYPKVTSFEESAQRQMELVQHSVQLSTVVTALHQSHNKNANGDFQLIDRETIATKWESVGLVDSA